MCACGNWARGNRSKSQRRISRSRRGERATIGSRSTRCRRCDGHRRAQRPGRGVRGARGLCGRFAASRTASREPACATMNTSRRAARRRVRALGRASATAAPKTRRSARYVSRDMIGYEDLDANGTWRNEPGYGNVWVPNRVCCRLDAVPRRTLGMGRSVGLDLGGRCALGFRRVPLRPLGELERNVGLGAGSRAQPGRLRAGAGRFRRRQQLPAFDLERKRRRSRVVPARAARGLPAVVSGQPRLFRQRQPQQHDRQQHDDHQRVQQHGT